MAYVLFMIWMKAGVTHVQTIDFYPTLAACEAVKRAHEQDQYADKRGKMFECRPKD